MHRSAQGQPHQQEKRWHPPACIEVLTVSRINKKNNGIHLHELFSHLKEIP
jgi:hypothetical protein